MTAEPPPASPAPFDARVADDAATGAAGTRMLSRWTGEFRDRATERAFRDVRWPQLAPEVGFGYALAIVIQAAWLALDRGAPTPQLVAHGVAIAAAAALVAISRGPRPPRLLVPAVLAWQLGLIGVVATRPPGEEATLFAAAFAATLMIALPGPVLLSVGSALALVAILGPALLPEQVVLLVGCGALAFLTRRHGKLARRSAFLAMRRLEHGAVRDPVAGCARRRHFLERAAQLLDVARRYDQPLSLILLDIDNFADVHASYGSAGLDAGLKRLGGVLARTVRSSDVVGRVGAQQFAILLPQDEAEQARVLAERLREAVTHLVVPTPRGAYDLITSLGISARSPADDEASIDAAVGAMLGRAGAAMARAKSRGRDTISTARDEEVAEYAARREERAEADGEASGEASAD